MDNVISKNRISIRLTDERWAHITEEHCELAGLRLEVMETVKDPSRIFAGSLGELIALREMAKGKYLAVIYREWERDGFIITAFLTKRIKSLNRRKLLWSK
ncbi:MAG: hypothetical protein HZC18_05460 [Candidatus Omnitrophica bacterium]|nr:hypothetical protein [Candidatus Omnitrophota bacterium]